jgi:hypothetical protein
MAYATLEVLAGRVRQDLERLFQGRRAALAEGLRDLLRLLLTAEAPPPLEALAESGEVRGLQTHLRVLASHLQTESRLPEALCARYRYNMSELKARSRYGVAPRTWDYVHRLAKELGWDLHVHVPLIQYADYAWHDELEEKLVDVEVVLDGQALEGMLLYALEGYLSPRRPRRKGYEVYGISLGMVRDVHRRRRGGAIAVTRYVSVMRSHPQLSAEVGTRFAELNPRSLDALLRATAAFYPQYQAVGDFHSHLYDDLNVLIQTRGWEYSESDEDGNITLAQLLADLGHRISVAFVIGIARSVRRVARGHFRGRRNTMQMSLANCRVIVGAYRSLGSGRLTQSNISLRLSGVTA